MSIVIAELKEQRALALKEADELVATGDAEKRDMTPDEKARFDALMIEHERLGGETERREKLEKAKSEQANSTRQTTPQKPAENATAPLSQHVEVVRHRGTLRAFTGADARENAYRSGMWLRAALMNDTRCRQWCTEHGLEFRAQSEGVNTAGGYLVPTEFENTVIVNRENYGVFRRECRVIPMGRDHMVIPRYHDGITAHFPGENTAATASDKSWTAVTLTAKKLMALTRMSTEVAEDAVISLADDLATDMAWAFAKMEDDCGFIGTGAATYGGIVGAAIALADGTHNAGYVTAAGGNDMFSEYTVADFTAVMSALPAYALDGAKWYCSQSCNAGSFDRLKLALAGMTAQMMEQGTGPRYAGYDIVVTQSMPTAITDLSGQVVALFGNLGRAACFGDRRGITVKVDSSRYLEYDQIAVQATERFDISVHSLGDNTTAGPLVGLEAET